MIVGLLLLALGVAGTGMNVLALVHLARAAALRRRYRENGEIRNIHRSYIIRSSTRLVFGVILTATALWPDAMPTEHALLLGGVAVVGISVSDWWAVRRAVELAHERLGRTWRGDGGNAA